MAVLSIFPTVNSDGDDNARAGRRTLAGLGLARAITYARSGRINAVRLRAEQIPERYGPNKNKSRSDEREMFFNALL